MMCGPLCVSDGQGSRGPATAGRPDEPRTSTVGKGETIVLRGCERRARARRIGASPRWAVALGLALLILGARTAPAAELASALAAVPLERFSRAPGAPDR